MTTTTRRVAVHFGAGIIGRGFIADLIHRSGYDVVFVDVDRGMVSRLNKAGSYRVVSLENATCSVDVNNLSAWCLADDHDAIVAAIASASLVTTSVWADNLPKVAGIIGEGLRRRHAFGGEPVNVMACENAVGASTLLRNAVSAADPEFWASVELGSVASFPNCSVDRMVFRPSEPDSLDVLASDSFELAIARDQLVDPSVLPIAEATYSEDIAAHVERKLWVVNGGHAVAGYLAAYRGWDDPREAFVRADARDLVTRTMEEASAAVAAKHGFRAEEMHDYISKIVKRYQLPQALYRVQDVARAPLRKLAPTDRLVGPAAYCEEHGLPNDHLVTGIAMALMYDEPTDSQSVELQRMIDAEGLAAAISHVSEIHPDSDLSRRIQHRVEELRRNLVSATQGKDE